MSLYQFAPEIQFGSPSNYGYWENAFTDDEIKEIIRLGEERKIGKSVIGGYKVEEEYSHIRESKTSWLELNKDTEWLYKRFSFIIRKLNSMLYKFDMYGFGEHFQYTVYEGDMNGHYDYHLDMIAGSDDSARKISCVMQLSDPSEYEGGELQILTQQDPTTIKKEKGFIVVFPSYLLHRVTPVTKGIRRSLVIWATGPSFK